MGKLISDNYGRLSAIALDPVEKKPLYHFYPGEKILSIGSVGCNMHCTNCQNENISQCIDISPALIQKTTIQDIQQSIRNNSARLFAFTYNEPTVYYEFMFDTAKTLEKSGTECAIVTNGYIMPNPLKEIIPLISAFNVDLKFFNNNTYRKISGATLQPVLKALELIKKSGRHLEITHLVIPGINDNIEEFKRMIAYIRGHLGMDQVLHLSRYFPGYKMKLPPTPVSKLQDMRHIAEDCLKYVYLGNTGPDIDSNTRCPSCDHLLVRRDKYRAEVVGIKNNTCEKCGTIITGKFERL